MALAGCGAATGPVQFYALSGPEPPAQTMRSVDISDEIALGIGPLEIPKMIDRPQIVTRGAGNKLNVAEFHRWGGALNEDILRTLTEQLSGLLKSNQVMAHPWAEFFEPDYRVYLIFHRFDGRLGDSVVLNATWSVTDTRGRKALAVKRSVITEPLTADDYESLVVASSRVLDELGRQIAAEITSLQGK
jgi:uncharacterized lipoprotein YmbA